MLFGKKDRQELTIRINGMHCGMCTSRMQKAFLDAKGVLKAEVTLEPGNAKIVYDAEKITPEKLRQIVTDTGYEPAEG